MRLLVTGACGFVGSTLIPTLLSALPGLEIVGLDNFLRDGSRGNVEPLGRLGVQVAEVGGAEPEPAGMREGVLHRAAPVALAAHALHSRGSSTLRWPFGSSWTV